MPAMVCGARLGGHSYASVVCSAGVGGTAMPAMVCNASEGDSYASVVSDAGVGGQLCQCGLQCWEGAQLCQPWSAVPVGGTAMPAVVCGAGGGHNYATVVCGAGGGLSYACVVCSAGVGGSAMPAWSAVLLGKLFGVAVPAVVCNASGGTWPLMWDCVDFMICTV